MFSLLQPRHLPAVEVEEPGLGSLWLQVSHLPPGVVYLQTLVEKMCRFPGAKQGAGESGLYGQSSKGQYQV